MNVGDIKKECAEVEELLLRGEMSHTDLANWFTDFCTRIGIITEEDEPVEEPQGQPFPILPDGRPDTQKAWDRLEADERKRELASKPKANELPDGYVVGYGSEKGNMCKICNRIFVDGEIYVDKGADSLCQVHAYQKGIIKMNTWQYERMKKEYGL